MKCSLDFGFMLRANPSSVYILLVWSVCAVILGLSGLSSPNSHPRPFFVAPVALPFQAPARSNSA